MNKASARKPIVASVNNVNMSNVPSGHKFQNKRNREKRVLLKEKPRTERNIVMGMWLLGGKDAVVIVFRKIIPVQLIEAFHVTL